MPRDAQIYVLPLVIGVIATTIGVGLHVYPPAVRCDTLTDAHVAFTVCGPIGPGLAVIGAVLGLVGTLVWAYRGGPPPVVGE